MRSFETCCVIIVVAMATFAQANSQETATPILTPKPGPAPAINGPRIYGARPGRAFLYRIPCTGSRPIVFSAEGLPASLQLDPGMGILSGESPRHPGEYRITLHAANAKGKSSRLFKLVVGDTLALTPPMGWNDWYSHYDRITDKLMREAADMMVVSGMADFGYQYVNIDDCWMVKPESPDPALGGESRTPEGNIRPNRNFPDMNALTAYIHSKGLKTGIYTSPGPLTCGKYEGSYQHEEADARQFAAWGFDFLKYDLCSYRQIAPIHSLEEEKKPYQRMGEIVRNLDRDLVFNLCQYGRGDVWKWGGDVGGQCWRTTYDLGAEKDKELPGFYSIAFQNAPHFEYARPGGWNDPDYILIGYVGDARKPDVPSRRTNLTADEQYSYMSMWALMASPLIYSGVMAQLDDFTLNVLCNAEVIDLDQDPLGKQARIVRKTTDEFILAKPLEDGSLAVGLFNLTKAPRTIEVGWADLNIDGRQQVRDVWHQKGLGDAAGRYSATVSAHGVSLVRLSPEKGRSGRQQ
jgi:alpha-galactosidase